MLVLLLISHHEHTRIYADITGKSVYTIVCRLKGACLSQRHPMVEEKPKSAQCVVSPLHILYTIAEFKKIWDEIQILGAYVILSVD